MGKVSELYEEQLEEKNSNIHFFKKPIKYNLSREQIDIIGYSIPSKDEEASIEKDLEELKNIRDGIAVTQQQVNQENYIEAIKNR